MRVALKQRLILVLFTIHFGKCIKANSLMTEIKTEFVKGKNVASTYKTLHGYSKSRCVSKCLTDATDGLCKAAAYDTSTQTCFLSDDVALEEGDPNSGAFVLIKKGKMHKLGKHMLCHQYM